MSSGPAAVSCDLEIGAASSLIGKGLLYVPVLLDLKLMGCFPPDDGMTEILCCIVLRKNYQKRSGLVSLQYLEYQLLHYY